MILQYCETAEAKFIVPDWGDIVNYGTGLSYRPAMDPRIRIRIRTHNTVSSIVVLAGEKME
jgi:hypothetical protein